MATGLDIRVTTTHDVRELSDTVTLQMKFDDRVFGNGINTVEAMRIAADGLAEQARKVIIDHLYANLNSRMHRDTEWNKPYVSLS